MTKNEKIFLKILGDYLQENTTSGNILKEADLQQLVTMARSPGVSAIMWKQIGKDIRKSSSEQADVLHSYFLFEVFRSVCQLNDLQEVEQAMNKAGIPYLLMKGSRLKYYYPDIHCRSMSDIDIVIKAKDRQASDQVMHTLGFRSEIASDEVWVYEKDVTTYELHDHMMYDTLANNFDYRSHFDRVWDHVSRDKDGNDQIDEEFHFLFMVVHLAKHMINEGIGIRAFMDLVAFVRKCDPSIDWNQIAQELDKMELLQFTKTCFALCRQWFGIDMPLIKGSLDREFFENASKKILTDGVFGHGKNDNDTGFAAKTFRKSSYPYWLQTVITTIRVVFPSYHNMRLIPWYSFVDGRPWLLPVAWIYRFFYCLFHKLSHSMKTLLQPIVKKEQIQKRQEMYDDWGL